MHLMQSLARQRSLVVTVVTVVTVRVRVEVTVYNQKSLYLIAVSVMHNCSLNLGFSHCYTTLG